MNETRADSDVSLPEFLTSRARHATDARLALDVAIGFVVALATVLWHGPGWQVIASGAVCFLGYGAWGIADRELTERAAGSPGRLSTLRVARLASAIVGVAGGIGFVMGGLFVLLGTIKS